MKRNFLRAHVIRAEQPGEAGTPIRFVASSAGAKRDGLDLDMADWYLDNYRKNPVFLWAHDYMGRNLPLGSVEVFVDGDKLMADVRFDQSDEFARQVEGKYRNGFLHTVSVGWNFIEQDKKRLMDLLDISGVPVPGDPDALMERQYEGLKRIFEPSSAAVDRTRELDWNEVAAEMVAAFDRSSEESDEERERRYRALLPSYRRLGRVAPEFLKLEDLQALDEASYRGLFLEGELPEPQGRAMVDGDAIRERILNVIGLLDEIIADLEEDDEPDQEDEPARGAEAVGESGNGTDELQLMARALEIKTQLMRGVK
jgi:hypothetical protein